MQNSNIWFVKHYRIKRSLEFVSQYDKEKSWRKLSAALQRKRMMRRIYYISSTAAAVAIFVCSLLYFRSDENEVATELVYHVEQSAKERKQEGVILSLADGSRINLSSAVELSNSTLKNDAENKKLTYELITESQDTLEWNTLEVPHGMDYKLVLSDGSNVWLNANSRLVYPKVFGGLREVKLEGEAYFDVASNKKRPFIVRSNHVTVKVLGTEFNINSYNPESVQTVLVNGKVEIENAKGDKVELKPGEMAETVGSQIQLSQVNIQKFIAWKKGEFYFENAPLEDIMQELSDWYDVQIVFTAPSLKMLKFSGVLKRDDSIIKVLKKIEQTTSVHFNVQSGVVTVK